MEKVLNEYFDQYITNDIIYEIYHSQWRKNIERVNFYITRMKHKGKMRVIYKGINKYKKFVDNGIYITPSKAKIIRCRRLTHTLIMLQYIILN